MIDGMYTTKMMEDDVGDEKRRGREEKGGRGDLTTIDIPPFERAIHASSSNDS